MLCIMRVETFCFTYYIQILSSQNIEMAANLTADPSTIVIGHVSRLSWLSFSKSQGIIDTLNSAAHFMLIVSALLSQIWTRLAETDWDYSTSRIDHKCLVLEDCCHSMRYSHHICGALIKQIACKPTHCQSCVVISHLWRLLRFVILFDDGCLEA